MHTVMENKLNLFGHICMMGDDRLVKVIMFRRMHGKSVRGTPQPHRQWLNDIKDWCGMELQQPVALAETRTTWWHTVLHVLDTNGQHSMD